MWRQAIGCLLVFGIGVTVIGCTSPARDQRPQVRQTGTGAGAEKPIAVHGRVALGNVPLAGARLQFDALPHSSRTVVASTDQVGLYSASLPKAGDYLVGVRAVPLLLGGARLVLLKAAESELDIPLPDTRFTVTVVDGSGRTIEEPVQIEVMKDLEYAQEIATAGVLRPRDGATLTLLGLSEGTYVVSADTVKGLCTTDVHRVRLKAGEAAAVRLILEQRSRRLRVVGPTGAGLPAVTVRSRARRLDAVGVGEFGLERTPPGSMVVVERAGFVPACRMVDTARGDMVVRLEKAPEARLALDFRANSQAKKGYLEGLPGSDCGVPISAFASASEAVAGALTRVTLGGVPAGSFGYRADAARVSVRNPGPPVLIPKPDTEQECLPRLVARPVTGSR
jgi:hypothetical protein